MKALLFPFVAVAGALTAVEAGANATMNKAVGSPWWPAIVFNLISLAVLAVPALFMAGPFPGAKLGGLPWWAWSGGVFGAIYFLSMMVGPDKLGSGLFTGLSVSAAVLTSIALDNWGLIGFQVHHAGPGRLIGAGLMVVGLICVAVF